MPKVDAERSSPHQLWRSVDALLGCGRVPPSQDIGVTAFHRFFEAKVAGVRASTTDAPPPSFTPAPTGCEFRVFRQNTTTDVIRAVKARALDFSTRVWNGSLEQAMFQRSIPDARTEVQC